MNKIFNSLKNPEIIEFIKQRFNVKFNSSISENEEIWNQVVKQTGHNALPTVFIGLEGNENGPVFVAGRDFKGKDEIIEIIKKYI